MPGPYFNTKGQKIVSNEVNNLKTAFNSEYPTILVYDVI